MSQPLSLTVEPHPLLDLACFVSDWPATLGQASADLRALLSPGGASPLTPPDDALRAAVRDLLRHGGYKPTGRGKPSSEYLLRAAAEGTLGSINAAVDACNAASLHAGLPISVVDADRLTGALRVGVAAAGTTYVFNASGQVIDVGGLLCLFDGDGPCANAVKDAQRTKTSPETRRTLSVVWGTKAAAARTSATSTWYRQLVEGLGATTQVVAPTTGV